MASARSQNVDVSGPANAMTTSVTSATGASDTFHNSASFAGMNVVGSPPDQAASPSIASPSYVGSPVAQSLPLQSLPMGQSVQQPQSSPARRQGIMNFSRFFSNSKDRNERHYVDLVTHEGSVKKEAWTLMSRGNTSKTRVRTLLNLQEMFPARPSPPASPLPRHQGLRGRFTRIFDVVMKNRNLQVSTLEGIWHETEDMLNEEETREPTLRAIIEMTQTQQKQLGLALRHTFFERIRSLGCDEKTLKWLCALSDDGKNMNGFEKSMDYLVMGWLCGLLSEEDNPITLKCIQLASQMCVTNAAYVSLTCRIAMLKSAVTRCTRWGDSLTSPCIDLFEVMMKFSDFPKTLIESVITVCCCNACNPIFSRRVWELMLKMLGSQLCYRTRSFLLKTLAQSSNLLELDDVERIKVLRSIRGSLYILSQATWGPECHLLRKLDAFRSATPILAGFERCMLCDPFVCGDVLFSISKLLKTHGPKLLPLSWRTVGRIILNSHNEMQTDLRFKKPCTPHLINCLNTMEALHLAGQYNGPTDDLFDLMEACLDCRNTESMIIIFKYRENQITQLVPDWMQRARILVHKFAAHDFPAEVRQEAVSMLQRLYNAYRSVSEHEIVTELLLPTLSALIPSEENCGVQYTMLNTLFDIARTMPVKSGESSALFDQVLTVIRAMFIDGLHNCFDAPPTESDYFALGGERLVEGEYHQDRGDQHQEGEEQQQVQEVPREEDSQERKKKKYWGGLCIENMELVPGELDQIIGERWSAFPPAPFHFIINMAVDHVKRQYDLEEFCEPGGEVRASLFHFLFSFRCCPITKRLMRKSEHLDFTFKNADETPNHALNLFIKLQEGKDGDFHWGDICELATDALERDKYWPVSSTIILGLGRILEHTEMVKTAGRQRIEHLVLALMRVGQRAEDNEYVYKENENEDMIKSSEGNALTERLKHLPIVLATLIGYSLEWENRSHDLCRQIIEYVRENSIEAILAASVAMQRAPEAMSSFSMVLLELLVALGPTPKRAIPILELLWDAAHVPQFYKFFQVQHFRAVTEVLAAYSVVRYYNPFIVACVHRCLMLWYSRVPEKSRPEIKKYMEERVRDAPLLYYTEGMSRQPSGDGRQESGAIYQLGGAPDTPPPMGGGGGSGCTRAPCSAYDQMAEELEKALTTFYWQGRIEETVEDNTPDRLIETSQEHFLVNDHIMSVRTLIEKDDDDIFLPHSEVPGSPPPNGTFPLPVDSSTPIVGTPKSAFFEQRRRHQSAVHVSRRTDSDSGRWAADDMEVSRRERNSTTSRLSLPIVTYTQVIVRNMYGRRAWLMKSLEMSHVDFEPVRVAGMSEDATSLLQHIAGMPGASLLSRKNDEQTATRLRNLDRLPGLELHAVGVLFKAPGQTTEAQLLANVFGSERYNKFIRQLGDPRTLNQCPGGLVKGKHGTYTYEYKDEITRIVFLIASLMPTSEGDPNCNAKKQLIGNNYVSIIFNESGSQYKLGPTAFNHIAIEVTPVDSSNLLVYVHSRKEISCWLGLQKVVLNDEAAVRLVRQIVVRSNLTVNVWRSLQENADQPYLSMAVHRLRQIRAFRERCVPLHIQ